MKICFVTPEFVTESKDFDGGLSNYLHRVSLGLLELGHQPVVLVTSDTTEVFSHCGIEVHRVNVAHQFQSQIIHRLYQSYMLNQYLAQYARENAVDVVQYASFLGVGYYRLPDLPSVVRISSYEPLWMTYYGHDIGQFKDEIALEEAAIRRADGVFGPSRLLAQEIEKNYGRSVQVIESPFTDDAPELDYAYLETFQLDKYLLFFGTLGLLKGVKTIAEALPAIFLRYTDLKFVFIGKDVGFDEMKMIDYVYAQAGSNRDRIIYIDKLEHKRLYPFVEKALAVVLPSRIDNFPNACIESMAHGKIVIGTRNTGFEQLIQDGVDGFLCERDNPESLIQSIDQVINLDSHKKAAIEKKARDRIELLQPRYVLNDHIDFYKKIITGFMQDPAKHLNKDDDFVTSILWEKLRDVDTDRLWTITQYKQLQSHFQQEMDAVRSSRIYRVSQKISQIFAYLFPVNSKRRAFWSILYRAMRNLFQNILAGW